MGSPAKFVVDAKASRFTAKAFASGLSAGIGHSPTIALRSFSGEIRFVPLDAASMMLNIRTESLVAEDEMSLKDRQQLQKVMHKEVLERARYPEIVFRSGEVNSLKLGPGLYKVEMKGQLSLRGVTRSQTAVGQVTIGPYNLRGSGSFEIRQSDFGIPIVNVAGGVLTLRKELKCAFFLVAVSEEQKERPDSAASLLNSVG